MEVSRLQEDMETIQMNYNIEILIKCFKKKDDHEALACLAYNIEKFESELKLFLRDAHKDYDEETAPHIINLLMEILGK